MGPAESSTGKCNVIVKLESPLFYCSYLLRM